MRTKKDEKFKLESVEELLGVVNEESAMDIEISKIQSFRAHPFKVLDDDKMQELIDSISVNGILTPVLLISRIYFAQLSPQVALNTLLFSSNAINIKVFTPPDSCSGDIGPRTGLSIKCVPITVDLSTSSIIFFDKGLVIHSSSYVLSKNVGG